MHEKNTKASIFINATLAIPLSWQYLCFFHFFFFLGTMGQMMWGQKGLYLLTKTDATNAENLNPEIVREMWNETSNRVTSLASSILRYRWYLLAYFVQWLNEGLG